MFLACLGHAAAQHQHLEWYVSGSVGSDLIHYSRLLLGGDMVNSRGWWILSHYSTSEAQDEN